MALGSAGSPNGSQPVLLDASQHHRTSSNRQNTEKSKDFIKYLKWTATIVGAVTFVMCFICAKLYISSAPGSVKKAVFMIFLFCNSIPMLTVVTIIDLFWRQHLSGTPMTNVVLIRAMALVTLAFLSMLVACMVGVCLVLILLPWNTYFT